MHESFEHKENYFQNDLFGSEGYKMVGLIEFNL